MTKIFIMKKSLLACILLLGISLSGFAQNDKLMKKADALVAEMNTEITSVDESLALTETQTTQLSTIHYDRLSELKKAKEAGADKSKNKEINKKYYSKIFKGLLTNEQMKARKTAKENSKK